MITSLIQSDAWVEEVDFLPYIPPDSVRNTAGLRGAGDESVKTVKGGSVEEADPLWLEALEMIDSDLHWLLQQPHHKFWCQVSSKFNHPPPPSFSHPILILL